MMKLIRTKYEVVPNRDFPVYWKATNAQLRTALYESDADYDSEEFYCVLTFSDIREDFESWTPEERAEYLGDSNTADYDVYDWIRDCMMNSLRVISGYHKKGA